jgi:predicted transport protein
MASEWACPKCKRRFSRVNQRHACGVGDVSGVLRGRSPELGATLRALERLAKTLGKIELVARERYVLFRSRRIFADVVIMSDAVRLAIHLPRKVEHAMFEKVVADRRHVTHVVKLRAAKQVAAVKELLKEAYDFSIA